MPDDSKNTPTTVRELGIQFQGFRDLVDERFTNLTSNIQRLADALENANSNKADKKDVDDLKLDVKNFIGVEFENYKKDVERKLNKKPVISILMWSLFSALITSVVLYEVMSRIQQ